MHRTAAALLASIVSGAGAQSLFLTAPALAISPEEQVAPIAQVSFFFVTPPQPRLFGVHDIVYIIVNENSSATSSASLETSKETEITSQLNSLLDLMELLQFRLEAGDTNNLDLIDFEGESEFTGEGDYDRSDRLNLRLAAEVVDVKPNGNLVLEARKSIDTDGETRDFVLTGIARGADVTEQNTILSTELANLAVRVEHEGELRDSAKKGVITRVLDALFNF
ncbi:MAG: flagellar basal body L-ring protein FlgH [Planctomycetota bacterium]